MFGRIANFRTVRSVPFVFIGLTNGMLKKVDIDYNSR